ncbi:ergothioneine biosynthesis protein EgtB [Novosphingobium sp. KCTC 2891]|uniref:ergothioneine biosynthesis protein EgtB n=1 Tax=Novosphingobium sp. KCTC 2891 TaxID=2989730 RepID=UPI00222131F4|nr:ergothioneine biosynthesis protein EgtB [Novosphingobium sp. KCTC 2891]MCW1382664.1 ergothioneine biosynthesis protein EgtB [Novosphingobium sp. KCTC 2891]
MPNAAPAPAGPGHEGLAQRYARVRALTAALAAPLSDADATLQSMDDASPAKWHLAHTTWFFETFVLRDHLPGYRAFDPAYAFLFNSYYEAEGARLARPARGMLSRPALAVVLDYRAHVDAAVARVLERGDAAAIIELGLAHEEQHQELLLTDIRHALWRNPLGPAMWPAEPRLRAAVVPGEGWLDHPGGIVRVGHEGPGFAFDCEGPAHDVLLRPFALSRGLVRNADWLRFMADGGYAAPGLWLSDGWDWVRRESVSAPLYWREGAQGWERFTLSGWQSLDLLAPVSHISFYEAEAFAAWAGARLPTEFEWEALAADGDPAGGMQLDGAGPVDPMAEGAPSLFGNCWQWMRSAYLPYPGFRPAAGAVGEYNGKFMSGQGVLRGGSCATPRGHLRATYRNFFQPEKRWQFTGLRLAKDI